MIAKRQTREQMKKHIGFRGDFMKRYMFDPSKSPYLDIYEVGLSSFTRVLTLDYGCLWSSYLLFRLVLLNQIEERENKRVIPNCPLLPWLCPIYIS